MRPRRLVVQAALVGMCACATEPRLFRPDAQESEARLELGTVDGNSEGFVPLTGDQPLVAGAQGGFHVWLKYRLHAVPVGKVRVVRTAHRVADERLLLRTESAQEVGPSDADGWWETPTPLPSFMCPSPIGVSVHDEAVRFAVQIRNGVTGAVLIEGSSTATPRCPADAELGAWCLQICSG